MGPYETGRLGKVLKRRYRSVKADANDTCTRYSIPKIGMVRYEYESERTILVPGSIYVFVLRPSRVATYFLITTEGRMQRVVRPHKVDMSGGIEQFDLATLPRNAKIACLGTRAAGKTNLAMDIARGRLVVSPRVRRSGYMPFERFVNVRQDLQLDTSPGPGVAVLEDGEYAINLQGDARYHELMYDPEVMTVMCMQNPVKQSFFFDHVFVFHTTLPSYRDQLWDSFMRERFETRGAFEAAFDRCAPGRHDCMVVADGRVWTYRAPRLRFGDGESIEIWDSDEPGPP